MLLMAGKFDFVNALYLRGIPSRVHDDVRRKGAQSPIRQNDSIGLWIASVSRLHGEVAAKVLGEPGFQAGKCRRVLKRSKLLRQRQGLSFLIEANGPITFRIVRKLPVLEFSPLLFLIGLVDVRMRLGDALLQGFLDLIQLDAGQDALQGREPLDRLRSLDGFAQHPTRPGRAWGEHFSRARIESPTSSTA